MMLLKGSLKEIMRTLIFVLFEGLVCKLISNVFEGRSPRKTKTERENTGN